MSKDILLPFPSQSGGGRSQERIIRLKEVRHITGLSRTKLYVLVKKDMFPKAVPIGQGSRARGWVLSHIDNWVQQQILAGTSLANVV